MSVAKPPAPPPPDSSYRPPVFRPRKDPNLFPISIAAVILFALFLVIVVGGILFPVSEFKKKPKPEAEQELDISNLKKPEEEQKVEQEVEEQKEAEEREAAAAERRWLQERKVLLQVEAANQQVKLLEKRLALEHEQQKRQAAERDHLEAKLREATQATVRAHASEAAHAAESQITRLQLEDNQRQMEQLQVRIRRSKEGRLMTSDGL